MFASASGQSSRSTRAARPRLSTRTVHRQMRAICCRRYRRRCRSSPALATRWCHRPTPSICTRASPTASSTSSTPGTSRGRTARTSTRHSSPAGGAEATRPTSQRWRRLRVAWPSHLATHSRGQTAYFDADGVLARHDYDVEISDGTSAAHYVSDYEDVAGIELPTKHRIFPRTPDGQSLDEPLIVSIELSEVAFTEIVENPRAA